MFSRQVTSGGRHGLVGALAQILAVLGRNRGPGLARTRRHPTSTTIAREITVKPEPAHISHVI